ncbi:MAG: LysR family transcriptional regulator [Bryobacterales bacterium]|nr:LysR family transcriptional regulator [Bryobacterales bacterium]
MELREVRTLIALARTGSIVRTAAQLNLTPAAVFKQLKNLEQEWAVRLYERRGRGLQLTDAVAVVLPCLREIQAQCEAAGRAVAEWQGLRRGCVRIGAGPTLASYVLPDLLIRFRKRWPGVDLHIQTGNSQRLIDGIRAGEIDTAMIISSGAGESPDMQVAMEWRFENVLVSNLPEAPVRCRLRDLHRFPFVLYEQGSRLEAQIDRYFERHKFQPSVAMRFDSAEAIKTMVALGLGISMLPMWTVREDLRSGRLRAITVRERPLISKFSLVCRKSAWTGAALPALIETARGFEAKSRQWLRESQA